MSGPGEPRPVIIIFGAAVRPDGGPSLTLRRRVMAAASFGATLEDPLYIPTGALGRHGPAEAVVMARLLQDLGVPGDAIRQELTATDTLSSATACAAMLRGHQGAVWAASSGYHLPRCVMLLRLMGLPARAAPPPEADMDWRDRWWWRAREGAALPVDFTLGLLARLRR
ncbi:YdcF family protein [Roseomonas marmotae]|uniref:YdcF family protein n=1 Tax=Roseomonas marmotae TaxID=2768161 RepID=A0ABS3KHL1_9PROT|nr:YdcF family protein [Roseomonas marmotae]MBO1076964.1 YdcF family protein [Roseomonas marmotae]QTI80054.1 YdcF family protein [Roseomonas marmotae]